MHHNQVNSVLLENFINVVTLANCLQGSFSHEKGLGLYLVKKTLFMQK